MENVEALKYEKLFHGFFGALLWKNPLSCCFVSGYCTNTAKPMVDDAPTLQPIIDEPMMRLIVDVVAMMGPIVDVYKWCDQ